MTSTARAHSWSSLRPLFCLLALFGSAGPAGAGDIPLVKIGLRVGAPEVGIESGGGWAVGRLHTGLRPTRVGAAWRFSSRGEGIQVWDETGRLRGNVADTLFAFPLDPEHPLRLDERAYRGELLLFSNGDGIVVVNVIDLESYVAGVVPLEIGAQPPPRAEAIKAQAVAARSYTLAQLRRWAGRGFDLLSTVDDQAYGGVDAEAAWCTKATEATRGVVAVDGDRRPIVAFYSSTCGGHSAEPSEVWGKPGAPYLKGIRDKTKRVSDSFCSISPRYNWTEIWEGSAFEEMLDRSLPNQVASWNREKYGRLRSMEVASRGPSKRVSRLVLEFERGTVELGGDAIRWAIRRPNGEALRSCMLTDIAVDRSDGRVVRVGIKGRGFGHGVGLCQFGAMGMSEHGYDYRDILRFYYRGSDVLRFY
ncbi:MAG: SpoIID/LytB domain-containing protein [Candidatus Eisenbacteria bacterium]|uniref:SpoIID/LytB domain-containing protein n=1 Tax=Eiseniibacteriota bacterium TaxID=2212470 RepID=A0A956LZZ9_UNCEI|nr:SpoIID/LytB domain-containing protein [Candidatus Eisenbacteria bacterium]